MTFDPFEISFERRVELDELRGSLSQFMGISGFKIMDWDSYWAGSDSDRFHAIGLDLSWEGRGYMTYVNGCSDMGICEDKLKGVAIFLAGDLGTSVVIGNYLGASGDSFGDFVVISPSGECRLAMQDVGKDYFDVIF